MHTFHAAQSITATLDLSGGNILVTAGEDDEVTVAVSPSNPSKPSDHRSAEKTRVEFSDGRLTVLQPRRLSRYAAFGSGNSIDVTIALPRGSRINANSSYGSIRIEGAIGPSTLKTSYGDVTVDEAEDLNVRTGHGEAIVNRARGHTDIVGGRVRINEMDGDATIKSSQDRAFVGTVTGPLQVTSSYGDIEIEHAFANIVAKSAYGKVRINDAVRGSIEMHSSYGQLELGIREGTAAWLDLDTNHGTVRNGLESGTAPHAGDEPGDIVEVLGRTSWGDIIIRRAASTH